MKTTPIKTKKQILKPYLFDDPEGGQNVASLDAESAMEEYHSQFPSVTPLTEDQIREWFDNAPSYPSTVDELMAFQSFLFSHEGKEDQIDLLFTGKYNCECGSASTGSMQFNLCNLCGKEVKPSGKEEQKIGKCVNCKHFQKKLFDANVENDTLRMELDRQAELTSKSHTLICSLKIIAERNGESTHWEGVLKQCHVILDNFKSNRLRQHDDLAMELLEEIEKEDALTDKTRSEEHTSE